MTLKKLIERWRRRRILRAVRILVNCPLFERDAINVFVIEDRGVLVASGSLQQLLNMAQQRKES